MNGKYNIGVKELRQMYIMEWFYEKQTNVFTSELLVAPELL
jgi:hypothetical protein